MKSCPLCKKEFDTVIYIEKGICSVCNKNILLEKNFHNQILKNYAAKTVSTKYKRVFPYHADTEKPDVPKKDNNNQSLERYPPLIRKEKDSQPNLTYRTESVPLFTPEDKAADSEMNSGIHNTNPEFTSKPDIQVENNKKEKHPFFPYEIFCSIFMEIKRIPLIFHHKRQNIFKEKHQEKKETNMEFNFNYDGYYNDTVSDSPAVPDVIPVKEILKVVVFFVSIILITIFIILYM